MSRLVAGAVFLVLTVFLPRSLAAQGLSQATVAGTVRDGSGAVVAAATVSVASPQLIGGTRVVSTGGDGQFRTADLPPGTYDIEGVASGFRVTRRTGVRLAAGGTAIVDITLEPAGVEDSVIVEGTATGVDVKSAAAPVRLDQDLLFNLPTSRDVSRLINLAPGIAADVAFGGSQRSNALFVDGTNMTDPSFQDPQLKVSHNWVEHVHISGLGAGAEYGGSTGVVANTVLRSGGNRTSGLGEVWTIQPEWLANNTRDLEQQLQTSFAPRQVNAWWEGSGQVGGAILRDRLWYFTGLQGARHDDRPAGFLGEGSRDEREWQWLGKVTHTPAKALRLEGFVQTGVREVAGEYLDRLTPIEASSDIRYDQSAWNLRASWTLGDRSLLEVRYSGSDVDSYEGPHAPRTRENDYAIYDLQTGMTSNAAFYYFDNLTGRQELTATLSRYLPTRAGAHDLKAGLEFDATEASGLFGPNGGQTVYMNGSEPYGIESSAGDVSLATTRRLSAFVQDAWSLPWRLTLSAGLRIDINRGSVPQIDNVFATTPVSPRVGLAWDVRGDHRTVARVHYGRYHDTIFSSRIAQADVSGISPYTFSLYVDGVFVPQVITPRPGFRVADDLRHSGVDQYVVGVDHELPWKVVLTAQGIVRRFDDFLGMLDEGSTYTPVERRDPGPDGRLNTADDGQLLQVFALTNPGNRSFVYGNPDQAYNHYAAAQVIARRPFSRNWQMQASYTWSRNEGTVGNRWHVNAARFDLGSPGRFVNPNSFINADGRATFDPTHEAKVLGTVRLPWLGGANISTVYRYTTGNAWGRRARITGLPQGQEGVRVEPQGTRRAEAINRLDLRAEKTFRLGGAGRTLGIFLEGFNVTNQAVADSDTGQPYVEQSGATFGQPLNWVSPRLLRAAVRYTF
ncbi:hypothetical protein TBR22_A13500 [Luteitalea sp. TBR-22]|uniref:TonB-dependent receptor n=1 Tax=Luteitalea sp. TBR-22 TaxID=2802971 RepID=UPI001AF6AC55|nr:carboxypeptidase regulatory-like domain-containing protein [Luteitalea sp. TBR-22]BCS32141.1 hypothetical protein TBR22_A13500 [Luteitalea sp. TBR-22]